MISRQSQIDSGDHLTPALLALLVTLCSNLVLCQLNWSAESVQAGRRYLYIFSIPSFFFLIRSLPSESLNLSYTLVTRPHSRHSSHLSHSSHSSIPPTLPSEFNLNRSIPIHQYHLDVHHFNVTTHPENPFTKPDPQRANRTPALFTLLHPPPFPQPQTVSVPPQSLFLPIIPEPSYPPPCLSSSLCTYT